MKPKLFEIYKIDIINNIKEYENPKVKTNLYSSLYAFTNDKDYQDLAIQKQKEYQMIVKKQERTKTEEENWITRKEFMNKLEEHKLIAENLWNSKSDNYKYTVKELLSIQNYIILVLVSHIYFPIRRSEDWTEMKIRGDIDRRIFFPKLIYMVVILTEKFTTKLMEIDLYLTNLKQHSFNLTKDKYKLLNQL